MADEDLNVRVKLQDELSGPPIARPRRELKGLADDVEHLDQTASRSHRALGRVTGGLGRMAGGVGRLSGRLRGTLNPLLRSGALLLAGLATAAAAAGAAMAVRFGRMATDAAETLSKFNTVFGSGRTTVEAWVIDTHRAFGITTKDLRDATSLFGVFGQAAGIAQSELPGFSTELAQAGLDLASFHNADPGEVFEALRSGLAGETEPLRRFGIFLNESAVAAAAAARGWTGDLTDAQKVAVRQQLILEGLGAAQGDLVRTQDSLANKTRALRGRFDELGTTLASAALPYVTEFVNKLDDRLAPAISRAAGGADDFLKALSDGRWSDAATILDNIAGAGGRLAPFFEQLFELAGTAGQFLTDVLLPALAGLAGTVFDNVSPLQIITDLLQLLVDHADVAVPAVQALVVALGVATLIANPWLAVVAAVLALVKAGQWAYREFDWFRDLVDNIVDLWRQFSGAISDFLASVDWQPLIDAAMDLWHTIVDNKDELLQLLGVALLLAVGPVAAFVALYTKSEGFRQVVNAVWRFILEKLLPAMIRFGARAIDVISAVVRWVGRVVAKLRDWWSETREVREALGQVARVVFSALIASVGQVVSWLQTAWDKTQFLRDGLALLVQISFAPLALAFAPFLEMLERAAALLEALNVGADLDKQGPVPVGDSMDSVDHGGGDTASTRIHAGRNMRDARYHAFAHLAARAPGRLQVTSAFRPGGSGDHGRGAVDVRGSHLGALAASTRSAGGFAELHGSGAGRHLHVVPPAAGDTATSRANRGPGEPGGVGVYVAPGAIVIHAEGMTPRQLQDATVGALEAYERDRFERDLSRA